MFSIYFLAFLPAAASQPAPSSWLSTVGADAECHVTGWE